MNRWRQVCELFDETVALEPAQRARVLHERAGADAHLIRQVEELIAADASPRPELDRSASDLLQELRREPPADELCGASFGVYRIDAHIASGGMAHVYRATRSVAGTERRVALKVLREGLDTETFLRRFETERATLAAMEHENIVAFVDAGSLPDGRPFLVMELVDGVPLTTWAMREPLRDRLRAFLQVLATVQYAHSRLLVHRDLKPSNVLVTAQGVPKLLDFGVAAVLEAELGSTSGAGPMTPVYASPEQLAGGAVGTSSDVYSLGVLLREIVDGEPRDSVRRTDLACIVAKACAHDPRHRYLSAFDFADDLRRCLANEPVAARCGATWYRLRLFARRQRHALLLTGAVLVSLAVGWISAELRRASAQQEASTGWGAHSQARVVARVYERWISAAASADPALAGQLVSHLEGAVRDLANEPEAETLVRMALAQLYLDRGDRARAAEHAERAWHLAQTTRGIGKADRERAAALRVASGSGG